MWFKMRYKGNEGIIRSRTGSDLLSLSAQCDGMIVAIYSWCYTLLPSGDHVLGWSMVYSSYEVHSDTLAILL